MLALAKITYLLMVTERRWDKTLNNIKSEKLNGRFFALGLANSACNTNMLVLSGALTNTAILLPFKYIRLDSKFSIFA